MSENNKNPPLPPVPQAQAGADSSVMQQYVGLVRDHVERELEKMGGKIDDLGKKMDEGMSTLGSQVGDAKKDTQDQIETLEGKINAKLDGVDEALRGNGRIGIFEQLRNLRVQTKVLFSIMLLLMGAKVLSLDLSDWTKSLFPHKETVPSVQVEVKQMSVEVKPSSQPIIKP